MSFLSDNEQLKPLKGKLYVKLYVSIDIIVAKS